MDRKRAATLWCTVLLHLAHLRSLSLFLPLSVRRQYPTVFSWRVPCPQTAQTQHRNSGSRNRSSAHLATVRVPDLTLLHSLHLTTTTVFSTAAVFSSPVWSIGNQQENTTHDTTTATTVLSPFFFFFFFFRPVHHYCAGAVISAVWTVCTVCTTTCQFVCVAWRCPLDSDHRH